MSKKKENGIMAFKFGEPEPVLASNLTDYAGVFYDAYGDYYTPPVSLTGLGKVLRANAHHNSIAHFKTNLAVMGYVKNPILTARELKQATMDFNVFGMMYFKRITNRFGHTLRLEHIRAIGMRRMKEKNRFLFLAPNGEQIKFKENEIIQISRYDVNQGIYGVPEYLGGIQSLLLNESATLFRRRYYDNGAHMGFILMTTDANLSPEDEALLKSQIKASKGVGNFRSLYLNIPNGNKDSLQLIPIGDIATKDEFERVKNISRNDIISAWRLHPALAGIMPEDKSGYGDIKKIAQVYYQLENQPLQEDLLMLNEYLQTKSHIRFEIPTKGIFAEA